MGGCNCDNIEYSIRFLGGHNVVVMMERDELRQSVGTRGHEEDARGMMV